MTIVVIDSFHYRLAASLTCLLSAFIRTRPRVLINNTSSSRRSNSGSDIPSSTQKPRRLPNVCYKDIELYLLKTDDDTHRDIWVAEVEFVNLKDCISYPLSQSWTLSGSCADMDCAIFGYPLVPPSQNCVTSFILR